MAGCGMGSIHRLETMNMTLANINRVVTALSAYSPAEHYVEHPLAQLKECVARARSSIESEFHGMCDELTEGLVSCYVESLYRALCAIPSLREATTFNDLAARLSEAVHQDIRQIGRRHGLAMRKQWLDQRHRSGMVAIR